MNRRFLSGLRSLPLVFAASILTPFAVPRAQAQAATRVEGEFLVRWASQKAPLVLAPGVDPSRWQQQSLRSQVSTKLPSATVTRTFAGSGWSLVRVPAGADADATRAQLARTLGSANISYNYRRRVAANSAKVPSDPEYGAQWHWPKVRASEAWGWKTGGTGVVVAVLDTGTDLTHPDITANLWKNTKEIAGNGRDDDGNGYIDDVYGLNAIDPTLAPQDDNGHGTHCAGLVGAVGNNKTNIAGACWSTRIMTLKFLDGSGQGLDSGAIECLEYAVMMKKKYGVNLRVISNSWSGPDDNPALKAAFQLAETAGILSVCAAGNGTNGSGRDIDVTPEYPASYTQSTIISVAASDENDALASFSNYGAKSVDIAAPGTAILSLRRGGGTREDSGTSMATPIVAGAATLIANREPSLTPQAIKTRLLTTVDLIPDPDKIKPSVRRLNMYRAVSNATLRITGQVYRLDGTTRVPLAGAFIRIDGKTLASTGTDGKYIIDEVAPDTYQIFAAISGYTFNTVTLTMPRPAGTSGAPNGTADFPAKTFPSTRYSISGRAVNASGQVQKGVSIFISGVPKAVAVTAEDGKYTVRERGNGKFILSAIYGDSFWTPSVASVTLPNRVVGSAGAPNGVINFTGSVPDKNAPALAILSPPNGARVAPGVLTASGTATDASGITQLYFQLTRTIDFDFTYYDWTNRIWTPDSSAPGIKYVKTLSGTSLNWTQSLPATAVGSYSLRAWGRDVLGNESKGEADKVSSFTVASSIQAARKAAPTPTPSVSGASS